MTPTMRPPRHAPRIRVRMGAGPTAPARARDALRPLRRVLDDDCLERLELVVSELVTNAVLHSGGDPGAPLGLEVRCDEHRVRVTVEDPGAGFEPVERVPGRETPGGWGLELVAELADEWWVEPGSPSRVIAELER